MDNLDKIGEKYNPARRVQKVPASQILQNVLYMLTKLMVLFVCLVPTFFKNVFSMVLPKKVKIIKNQVVLVTGGANGLGKSLCLRFAAEGCHIAVADLDFTNAEVTAKEVKEKYGVKAVPYKLDVTNYDAVEACKTKIEADLGPVDILVNNAGVLPLASLREGKPSDLERIISVNLTSHLWTNRVFLEPMIKNKRGHIVAIASIAGIAPGIRAITYSASKCGVRGLMHALQDEIELEGFDEFIHTTTVYPWFISTRQELVDNVTSRVPQIQMLGVMSPRYVADNAVRAVLVNQETIIIPKLYSWGFYVMGWLSRDYRKVIRKIMIGEVPKMMK